jgi:hypothetical protein
VIYEVLAEVSIKCTIFWDLTPCSFVDFYGDMEKHIVSIFRVEELAGQAD